MGRAVLSSRPTTGLERLAAVPSGPYCLNCRKTSPAIQTVKNPR
jgi:hypothetical protein